MGAREPKVISPERRPTERSRGSSSDSSMGHGPHQNFVLLHPLVRERAPLWETINRILSKIQVPEPACDAVLSDLAIQIRFGWLPDTATGVHRWSSLAFGGDCLFAETTTIWLKSPSAMTGARRFDHPDKNFLVRVRIKRSRGGPPIFAASTPSSFAAVNQSVRWQQSSSTGLRPQAPSSRKTGP